MKREILFRGKRICENKNWVEGCLLNMDEDSGHVFIVPFFHHASTMPICRIVEYTSHYVSPETVGQFTGLTDKNGKKIFEGDIFKFPDEIFESYYTSCGTEYNSWETENYGVVGYDEYYGRYDFVKYRFENNAVEADLNENKDIDFAEFVRELEVIGNIHDNPDLLEGGVENG